LPELYGGRISYRREAVVEKYLLALHLLILNLAKVGKNPSKLRLQVVESSINLELELRSANASSNCQ
jgi:hypothetical protein